MPTIGRRPGRFSRLFFFYSLSHSQKEGEKNREEFCLPFSLFSEKEDEEKKCRFSSFFHFSNDKREKGEEYEWISAPVSPIFRKKKAERKEERNNP